MKEPREPLTGRNAEQAPRRGALLVMRAMKEPREPSSGRRAARAPHSGAALVTRAAA
jgi:hypothetical protein